MHRSRLTAIVIDCLDEHFEACVAFWAAAFGDAPPRTPARDQRYVTLKAQPGDLKILLQRVQRDPGVHLDFESDAVARETRRMEAAGATRKYWVKRWQVMQDPSGNAFCIVDDQMTGLLAHCRPWPDDVLAAGDEGNAS